MLNLLQSIFGLSDSPQPIGRDDKLIELATERVIDGTDPRLRAVSGYRKTLRPAVECAVDHVIGLVDSFPHPIELSRQQFGLDERVRALFVSPDHLSDTLLRSRALQDYLDHRTGLNPENIYALLGVEQREKNVLGMELEGEILRRDVAQVAISFSNHQLMGPVDSEQESDLELKKRAFDFLIELALKNIASRRSKQTEALRQRDLLSNKLQALESTSWAMDTLLDQAQPTATDPRTVEQRIAQLESELAGIDADPITLDHYFDAISECLNAATQHLRIASITLRLNRMGIKTEDDSDPRAITLELEELAASDGRKVIVVPVYIPFAEIPEKPDFLTEASRYL